MEENKANNQENLDQNSEKLPNENAGFYFSSHFKIFDPKTNEVFVKQRGE